MQTANLFPESFLLSSHEYMHFQFPFSLKSSLLCFTELNFFHQLFVLN